MRTAPAILLLFFAVLAADPARAAAASATPEEFIVLCYHDFGADVGGNPFSVRTKDLIEQFEYLKAHYNVIGWDDVEAARKGLKPLPEKAVLLTVDDGLKSYYDVFFPLQKLYGFKAIFGVVGKWTDKGTARDYGLPLAKDPRMATWPQLKEMSDSGLVSIASHTFDLHQGVMMNPQGNEGPSAGFLKYDAMSGRYETEEAFKARISKDLLLMKGKLKRKIGIVPPLIVWPYGSFNGFSREVAEKAGFPVQLSVEPGLNSIRDLSVIRRHMIMASTPLHDFAELLERGIFNRDAVRGWVVDLDLVFDEDPMVLSRRIDRLIERVRWMGVNEVYLTAASNLEKGSVYFPAANRKLRADLLGHVAHAISKKTKAESVYAIWSGENEDVLTPALARDLAKSTDLAGVILDLGKGNVLSKLERAPSPLEAARRIRPLWKFGFRGDLASAPEMKKQKLFSDRLILDVRSFTKADQEALRRLVSGTPSEDNRRWVLALDLESVGPGEARALAHAQNRAQLIGFRNLAFSRGARPQPGIDEGLLRSLFSSLSNPFQLRRGDVK